MCGLVSFWMRTSAINHKHNFLYVLIKLDTFSAAAAPNLYPQTQLHDTRVIYSIHLCMLDNGFISLQFSTFKICNRNIAENRKNIRQILEKENV